MGDTDYLIYGSLITIFIIILNIVAFIAIPVIISKLKAKEIKS